MSGIGGDPGTAILDSVSSFSLPAEAPWQVIDAKLPGVWDRGVFPSEAITCVEN